MVEVVDDDDDFEYIDEEAESLFDDFAVSQNRDEVMSHGRHSS